MFRCVVFFFSLVSFLFLSIISCCLHCPAYCRSGAKTWCPVHIPDLDCKLKSATQTPAALHNNLHNNVPEILGRSNVNNSQMYYKTVSTHFASCIIILIFKIVSDSLYSIAVHRCHSFYLLIAIARIWFLVPLSSHLNMLYITIFFFGFAIMSSVIVVVAAVIVKRAWAGINVTVDILRPIWMHIHRHTHTITHSHTRS